MKLLHITATHLEKSGGIPAVLYDLIEEQNKIDGFEARLLSVKATSSSYQSEYFDYLGKGQSLKEYIKQYEPDIAILHGFFYKEYISVSKTLRQQGVKYYIEPHGSFGKAANQKAKVKKQISYKTVFRGFLNNAFGYIFLNADELSDAIYRTENDIVIPNGVKQRGAMLKPVSDPTFYYLGRYDFNHKGLDYLLKALEILDQGQISITFDFFGTGSADENALIDNAIKSYNNIKAYNNGPLYEEKKEEYLNGCRIMVLTSRYEGFPMTVLEALSHGNPCIVTPGTNVKNMIENNQLGWGTSLDSGEIAESLRKAYEDYQTKGEQYVSRCQNYVQKNLRWDQIALLSYKSLKDKIATP